MAPAVISPEARMSSISCAVLIWIMRPLHFASSGRRPRMPVVIYRAAPSPGPEAGPSDRGRLPGLTVAAVGTEGAQRAGGDLLDGADRVDLHQETFSLVEARQGRRLFPVHLQPVAHRLRLVVVALDLLAVDDHPAAREPADELLLLDDQLEDAVEPVPELRQRGAQLLGLRDGPGEPVEQEAGL